MTGLYILTCYGLSRSYVLHLCCRYNFDAIVSNYSLASTYFPAFKMAVREGQAAGVMCSYVSEREF